MPAAQVSANVPARLFAVCFALSLLIQSYPTVAQTAPVATIQAQPQSGQNSTLEILGQPELAREQAMEIRSQGRYARVTITVTRPTGGYVADLTQNELRVFEDGVPRPVLGCQRDAQAPVSVGIIIDVSYSMVTKLAQARLAIRKFVADLNPEDEIFLLAFSDHPEVVDPLTLDHAAVLGHLDDLQPESSTALFDATLQGLRLVNQGRYDKKALLVVTDGIDNMSRSTRAQADEQARRQDVLLYSIGVGDSDAREVDVDTLRSLSRESGARSFIVPEVGNGLLLSQDVLAISGELRLQYTVDFLALGVGGFDRLGMKVAGHPDYRVRVRASLGRVPFAR